MVPHAEKCNLKISTSFVIPRITFATSIQRCTTRKKLHPCDRSCASSRTEKKKICTQIAVSRLLSPIDRAMKSDYRCRWWRWRSFAPCTLYVHVCVVCFIFADAKATTENLTTEHFISVNIKSVSKPISSCCLLVVMPEQSISFISVIAFMFLFGANKSICHYIHFYEAHRRYGECDASDISPLKLSSACTQFVRSLAFAALSLSSST